MKSVIVMMGVLLGLAGCTQPGVKFNPPPTQYMIDYTQQWRLLAKRTVDKLVKDVAKATPIDLIGHTIPPSKETILRPLGSRPYFIHTAAVDAPFAKIFTPLLQQELVKRGYTVSRTPHNALIVNYSVQTFYYRQGRRPIEYATFWATAAALGYALEVSPVAAIASGLVVAGALDVLVEMGKIISSEAVLTTSVVASNHIIHQASESFYVTPTNLPFYWSQYPTSAPMETETIRPVVEPVRTFIVQSR